MPSLSRRRFLLAGSAAAALAASGAGALVLRRDDDSGSPPAAPTAGPTATPTRPAPATPAAHRGGTARLHSPASFNFDTFDALRSGEPSVLEILGRTHSRLVDWIDPPNAILGPGLATSWEQPEPGSLILHLNPEARWHDRSPLNGVPVDAEQIRDHLRRAVDLALAGSMPGIQRPQDWLRIRSVTAPGDTIRIDTEVPDPFLLHTLASRFALVQAPRAVTAFEASWHERDPGSVVGSGAFRYDGTDAGIARFSAHPSGHDAPLVDAMEISEPVDLVERFRSRQLDEVILRDRRDAPAALEGNEADITALWRHEDSPIITTLSVGGPPWNNLNLRLGLSAALNRGELARRLFSGRATPAATVSPAHEAFAPAEADLARFPGYRSEPEQDLADARRYWEAGGGNALGPLTLDLPAVFDPAYSASAVIPAMLREALGIDVLVRVDSYTTIAERVAAGAYGNGQLALWFGWGPPDFEPDPSRALIETFDSATPAAGAFGYQSVPVNLALESLRSATELNERKDGVKRVQSHLLDEGGGPVISWLLQKAEVLRWNYLNAPPPSPFWAHQLASRYWIDPTNPAFPARPS